LGEGDEGRDGALAGDHGPVHGVVLADLQEGKGGDLLLPRGADLHHLDQDGDAAFLDGGGTALGGAHQGVEDVRGLVHHAGLRVGHEVQQRPHGAGLHGALPVLARAAAERVQRRGGVLLPARAPGLEEGDQQRDRARAADGGRGGAVELGQPEQRASGVLPRGGRRGGLERVHQRPYRSRLDDDRLVLVADGEVEQRRDAVLLQQRVRVRQQLDERPDAARRGDADTVVRVVLGQQPELHGRAAERVQRRRRALQLGHERGDCVLRRLGRAGEQQAVDARGGGGREGEVVAAALAEGLGAGGVAAVAVAARAAPPRGGGRVRLHRLRQPRIARLSSELEQMPEGSEAREEGGGDPGARVGNGIGFFALRLDGEASGGE